VLALLTGPAGLGLLGVLTAISGAGTTLAALGTDSSATRRIALARDTPGEMRRLRLVLAGIAVVHGLVVLAALWLLRSPISAWTLASPDFALEIGLTGAAVALSLAAGLQIAQLQGHGRVRDIARINIVSSIIGTVVGLAAVLVCGLPGLIVLVVAQPAVGAVLAARQTARLGAVAGPWPGLAALGGVWLALVREGAPLMLSYLVLALVPLAIRAIVIGELGMAAGGHFHAAWTMSALYVGFLLSAMSADYFPRLSGLVHDPRAANHLINDQIELGLAIGGVAILVVLALAPVLVPLLYSKAFQPAVEIVEWQALGNLLKIAGWPIAFLSMARGRSLQFLAIELAWSGVLLAAVWFGLPQLGLVVTGLAFAVAAAVFLMLQSAVAAVTFGFIWRRGAFQRLIAFAGAAIATRAAAHHSAVLQAIVGLGFAATLGVASVRLVMAKAGGSGPLMQRCRRAFASVGWPLPA
jgi:O-antigen/teichoic acid export membrane protein